ncbi:MAG TPA: hypothetical protein VJM09_16980 [Sphingobium sp.]|nr:hypothetical protein [Sphingobium sp.]
MKLLLAVLSCLLATGCEALPRDPEGTLNRIESSRTFKVGAIGPAQAAAPLIAALEQRTGARAAIRPMTAEPALQALDDGRIDLVIGPFLRDSPWSTDVAFGPPLAVAGSRDHPIEYKAAVRNGENRWLMTVERASRAASAQARAQ